MHLRRAPSAAPGLSLLLYPTIRSRPPATADKEVACLLLLAQEKRWEWDYGEAGAHGTGWELLINPTKDVD
jgi:hypothetical protein